MPGLAQTIGNSDGEKTKEIKVQKEKEKEKEDDGEKAKVKEKVRARVKAKRGEENESNPHSVHLNARIGIQTLALLATTVCLITRQTVKTGKTDGASGIKNVALGTSRVKGRRGEPMWLLTQPLKWMHPLRKASRPLQTRTARDSSKCA